MAYPTVNAPYGFKPINRLDGVAYAGAIQQYSIASNYNTAIFFGDTVKIVAGGTIEKSGATTTGTIVGVFVGVQYVNADSQTRQAQYYPGTSVTEAIAYVVVDPLAVYKVALTTSGAPTVITPANATILGTNVATVAGTGSTATGNSGSSVLLPANGAGDTTTLPFRVVGLVPETAYIDNNVLVYPEVLVKVNDPQFTALTGTTYTA